MKRWIGLAIGLVCLPASIVIRSEPQSTALLPRFEVATVKVRKPDGHFMGGSCHGIDSNYPPAAAAVPALGRCTLVMVNLSYLIGVAYAPAVPSASPQKITGGPAWLESQFWDIEAKADDPSSTTREQLTQMLQALLADRFKLQFHREQKETQGYWLVVSKGGLKIKEADPKSEDTASGMSARPIGDPERVGFAGSELTFRKSPLSQLAMALSGPAGMEVLDKTGLAGLYSFTFLEPRRQLAAIGDDLASPTIFTALTEQLGLNLQPNKVPVEFIVIDHVEMPVENQN